MSDQLVRSASVETGGAASPDRVRRILVLSRYGRLPGPSRYRLFQFIPYLEQRGFHVTIAPLLNDDYVSRQYVTKSFPIAPLPRLYSKRALDLLRVGNYDLVWLEKEALPWVPAVFEHWLGLGRVPYAVDYDDAIFHTYDQHRLWPVRRLLGKKIARLMKHAAVVLSGNDYLSEYALRSGARRVELLPSIVDLERYPEPPAAKHPVFTIGWTGAPANSRHIEMIAEALRNVIGSGKGRLHIIGGWKINLPSDVEVEYTPFSPADEVEPVQRFDVGIMPLQESPWERGKCGMKLVNYMACTLPTVATPVGVNSQLVEHGITGFIARTVDDWTNALTILRDNPDLRLRMGRAGRDKVERSHSLQIFGPKLADWFVSVARRRSSEG